MNNIVKMPGRAEGGRTAAICASVRAKSKRERDSLLEQMREITVAPQARHREKANELSPIAMRMDAPMLQDFIEIGQQLLAGRAGA